MKQLSLLRHATAGWSDDGEDIDRPLSDEGRDEARRVGMVLAGQSFDLILCSTATRTRETLELLTLDSPVRFEPLIYEAAAPEWMRLIAAVDDDVQTLLLVGHMPSIVRLSLGLSGDDEGPIHSAVAHGFPPAALVSLELDIDHWRDLAPRCGRFVAYRTPD